jgi:hypothetical protein
MLPWIRLPYLTGLQPLSMKPLALMLSTLRRLKSGMSCLPRVVVRVPALKHLSNRIECQKSICIFRIVPRVAPLVATRLIIPTPRHRSSPYLTPSRRNGRRNDRLMSSPILVEHPSWAEYDGDGLKAFTAHCESKYKVPPGHTAFQEVYNILSDCEIQPDVMKGKNVGWYEDKGIKSGTAERIVAIFNKWYAKMQQELD